MANTLANFPAMVHHPDDAEKALLTAAREYLTADLDMWHALEPTRRTEAVASLLESSEETAIDYVSDRLWTLRHEIRQSAERGTLHEHETVKPVVDALASMLRSLSDVESLAVSTMEQRLLGMGAHRFVASLEATSRPKLEGIILSGRLMGATAGAAVGALVTFLS